MKLCFRHTALLLIIVVTCSALICCCDSSRTEANPPRDDTSPVALRLYIGEGGVSSISFGEAHLNSEGKILLVDGKESGVGQLKPVWAELAAKVGAVFEDKYTDVETDLASVDIIVASIDELKALAVRGALADLSAYSSIIPNLKRLLFDTDLAYALYGESDSSSSGIFYVPTLTDAPVFTLTPKFNEDILRLLLDGKDMPECPSVPISAINLSRYMPSSGKFTVEIPDPGSDRVTAFDKDYSRSANIFELFEQLLSRGALTGKSALKLFRDYIDQMYGGFYGERRSDLFIGKAAMWDVDELRALLICCKANRQLLEDRGLDSFLSFSDEDSAIAAFGSLCGARGLSAESGFVYTDADGRPRDARIETETYVALNILGECVREGLVSYASGEDLWDSSAVYFDGNSPYSGYKEALPPVARWYNGTVYSEGVDLGAYFRYTDSVRLYENYGIAISRAGVSDPRRLAAALKLLDYMYSDEGRTLLCYGISASEQKEVSFYNYMGLEIPLTDEEIISMSHRLGYSSVTTYMKDYLGTGLCVLSSGDSALSAVNRGEPTLYSRSVEQGIIRTLSFEWAENEWYTAPPVTIPLTAEETSDLALYTAFTESANSEYRQTAADIILGGFPAIGSRDPEEAVESLKKKFGAGDYMVIIEKAFRRLSEYRDKNRWEIEY